MKSKLLLLMLVISSFSFAQTGGLQNDFIRITERFAPHRELNQGVMRWFPNESFLRFFPREESTTHTAEYKVVGRLAENLTSVLFDGGNYQYGVFPLKFAEFVDVPDHTPLRGDLEIMINNLPAGWALEMEYSIHTSLGIPWSGQWTQLQWTVDGPREGFVVTRRTGWPDIAVNDEVGYRIKVYDKSNPSQAFYNDWVTTTLRN